MTSSGGVWGLLTQLPDAPRLTWYSAGERIELSTRVLNNWVAKSGNLLVEECEVAPGTGIRLDLPPHWRTVVLALAAWAVGARFTAEDDVALALTDRPDRAQADLVVAVALGSLARRFDGPDGFDVDYAAEVANCDDRLLYPCAGDAVEKAAAVAAERGWGPGARVLATLDRIPDGETSALVALAAVSLGGSLVLCDVSREAVASQEGVTDTW